MKMVYPGCPTAAPLTISPSPVPIYLIVALGAALAVLMAGCAKTAPVVTPPPPKIVEVAVAVPVKCEVESVDVPDYPARTARVGDDVFTLAKIAAAERRVLRGEVGELRAANKAPCGE